MLKTVAVVLAFPLVVAVVAAQSEVPAYDPLRLAEAHTEKTVDLVLEDAERERRIPLLVYLPQATAPSPVILYSHGLGGNRKGASYLGKHWSGRGYVVVFMQHEGSDEGVWKGLTPREIMPAMRKAASAANRRLRIDDVGAVLDGLARWSTQDEHALKGRLDLERVALSGHSFGAVTTQAVAGQRGLLGRAEEGGDSRIKVALPMSPSPPAVGRPETAFGAVAIPWMVMTGTNDTSPINDLSAEDRLKVFAALPKGGKYQLVLDGAAHSAFTDRPLAGERRMRKPSHHRSILAHSTAFFDAWLRKDAAARAWLDGDGPARLLDPGDRFDKK